MKKLKVFDFDHGCGGFTKGLEDSNLFEVVYNGSINKKNSFCYNNTHINTFSEKDIIPNNPDLVIYTPHLGNKLQKIGRKNIEFSKLNNFIVLSIIKKFRNLIFITSRDAIPLIHINNEVKIDSNGYPTRDIISCRLLDSGYNVFNFVLDGAGFGLPQHKYYNIYWASLDIEDNIFIKEGFGLYKRPYRLPKHFLKDIDDDSNISWHNPDYSKKYECSCIKQGQGALNSSLISSNVGYVRLWGDKLISPILSYDFYNVSSKAPSIHPYYDRPLTIREGARLCGLTDDFKWDYKLNKKDVAMMIYESFPAFISKLMAFKIAKLIKKNK